MPEGSETESAELARCALEGEPLEAEVRRGTANGRRDFLLRGVPIRQGETVTGGCTVYTDITGRKRREQQVQVLNRVLRHNLRNDLNVAQGYVGLLLDEPIDAELLDSVRKIEAKAAGLVSLSETAGQFRAATRTEHTPAPVDVSAIVKRVGTAIERAHPEAAVSIRAPTEPSRPPVRRSKRHCRNSVRTPSSTPITGAPKSRSRSNCRRRPPIR